MKTKTLIRLKWVITVVMAISFIGALVAFSWLCSAISNMMVIHFINKELYLRKRYPEYYKEKNQ